jgi:hypothetical protein
MPRLGPHVFAPILYAEAFPIKASDHPLKGAVAEDDLNSPNMPSNLLSFLGECAEALEIQRPAAFGVESLA